MKTLALILSFCSLSSAFTSPAFSKGNLERIRSQSTRAFVSSSIDTAQRQSTETPTGARKSKIVTISSAEEYLDFLAEDDRLCMVKFHASWCKSCQKFGMQYERIAQNVGDMVVTNEDGTESIVEQREMRFAEIEYGANRKLCKSLGVKKVPSVHFYSRGKMVDGFPCGPKKIAMLLEKLTHYRSLSHTELAFEADMNQGLDLGDSVLLEVLCSDDDKSNTAECIAKANA